MATHATTAMGKDGQCPTLPIAAISCVGVVVPENPCSAIRLPTQRAKRRREAAPPRLPKMGLHKATGQARVTLSGVEHYLGRAGTPEAHARYAALVKQWLADGKRPLQRLPTPVEAVTTVGSLFEQFLAHADTTGRYHKNGSPTAQRAQFAWVGKSLAAAVGSLPITKLTEAALIAWRDVLEQNRKRTRSGINRLVAAALQVLRWGRSRALVPKAVWADIVVIEPLKRGEVGDRPEKGRPRRAVTASEAERVAQCASTQIAAMIRLQTICGMRPGEVCAMRWADINKTPIEGDKTGCWTYVVPNGKTAHHGHVTRYLLPNVAQEILQQFPATPLAYVFSPATAMAERRKHLRASRRTPPTKQTGQRDENARRDYGERWGLNEYRHAVDRACIAAKVQRFTPHELRHGFITWAANTLSLTAAAAAANHRNLTTTQGYVHVRHDDALAVAAAVEARMRG